MLYEIYLENGWTPWLVFQTTNETEANELFKKTKGQYVYLRVLDDNGYVISIRCEKH